MDVVRHPLIVLTLASCVAGLASLFFLYQWWAAPRLPTRRQDCLP